MSITPQLQFKFKKTKKSNPMNEISAFQSVGLFSSDFGKIEDEAQILKSRNTN